MHNLWIDGPFPGQNEIVSAAKGFRGRGYGYSKMKKEWTAKVRDEAWKAKLPCFIGPVFLRFTWVEPSRRRDKDNVAAAKKFVLDGLVDAGVLSKDGWKQIDGFADYFGLCKKNPGCLVVIEGTPVSD